MSRRKKKRQFGAGSVYKRGGGGWRIRWREGGRRRYASGYESRELAEEVLSKVLADIAAGRAGLPPDPKSFPPLAELAEDWLERRKTTHRSHRDDRYRWDGHLKPFFGHHRPAEVTPAEIRRFAEAKLAKGLSSTTVGHCVRLLSTFFTDLAERGLVATNPARAVPRATRRLYRNAHDPRTTPFLERHEDIRRVFLALEQPHATLFAIGALAGLRPGEVLGLEWGDVDLEGRRIHVRRQVQHGKLQTPKDDESRVVPIVDSLLPILAEWRLATGGAGQLFRPTHGKRGGRPGSPARFLGLHTVHAHLEKALKACGLPETLTLYHCTRHTFASQWVMGGGSIEQLRLILGHSSVTTTERYAHLRTDLFRPSDLQAISIDLSRPAGAVLDLAAHRAEKGTDGCGLGADASEALSENVVSSGNSLARPRSSGG